jgi:hypothetical protein
MDNMDNIKTGCRKIGCEDRKWMKLAHCYVKGGL